MTEALTLTAGDIKQAFRFSSAQAIALCSGRPAAVANVPPLSAGEAAERGTARHAVLTARFTGEVDAHGELFDALPDEEQGMVEALSEKTKRFIESNGGLSPAYEILCEREFQVDGWSGHPDFMAVAADGETVLLADWKGPADAPDTEINAQIRGYVLCALQAADCIWGIEVRSAVAAIISPFSPVRPVLYFGDDFREAREEMERIRARALEPDAPRTPGPVQCKYCPALGTSACPESYSMGFQLMSQRGVDLTTAPASWLVAVVRAGRVVAGIVGRIEDEIERRVTADPESVAGARMVTGMTRRKITEPLTAYQRAIASGYDAEELVSSGAFSPSLGKLERLLGKDVAGEVLEGIVEKPEGKEKLVIELECAERTTI